MDPMAQPKHATSGLLRRARVFAWTVLVSMAGTTMAYQVYHSLKYGHMPWELAYLYGSVPLLISMCILEIVTEWDQAPRAAVGAAYLIMGGAMFLSASATGAVVLAAAPKHWSLLFGVLMDGAALLAVHFLLNGPRKAAEQAAAAAAEQAAREAEAADERTALRAELTALREANAVAESGRENAEREAAQNAAAADELAAYQAELAALRDALEAERDERGAAEQRAAGAEAKTEALSRKLAAQKARTAKPNSARGKGPDSASATRVPADFDAHAKALEIWTANPGISGRELGEAVGRGERWGQFRKNEFADAAPRDVVDGDGS